MTETPVNEEAQQRLNKVLNDLTEEFSEEFAAAFEGVRGDISNRVTDVLGKECPEHKRSAVVDDVMTSLLMLEFAEMLVVRDKDVRKRTLKTYLENVGNLLDDYDDAFGDEENA